MYNSPNIFDRMKTKIAVNGNFRHFFSLSYNKNRHTKDATKIKKKERKNEK